MKWCRLLIYACFVIWPALVQAAEHCQICSRSNGYGIHSTYMKDSALAAYDVGFYWIDIEVNDTSTYVRGNTAIYARSLQEITVLVF